MIVLSMGAVSAHLSEQPAVTIETPIHNTEVSGEVEIVATVEDHYTTEHVNFTIEGLDDSNKDYQTAYQDNNSEDGWKYTWDSTQVTDGRYYVQAKALSSNGLKGGYNILLNVANAKIVDNSSNSSVPETTPSGSNSSTSTDSDLSYNFTQIYGTYLGGDGEDKAKGVCTDALGNIYIVMETNSNDLNTTEGVFQANKSGGKDIYVAKFDSTGELVFATFIGGSGTEFEKDFKVDSEGNIYITGLTASKDFPTTDNALIRNLSGSQSAYLAVLSADGKKLKYSTYLGGSKVDRGWALVIDDEGHAFVQGITNSIDFPVTDNAYQKTKDGIDWNENTSSDDIDFQNSFDLFISEIDTNTGELVYSTYFGGRGADSTYGSLAVKDNIVYFAGTTDSIDFPTTPNANRTVRNVGEADSFLAAIDITNNNLLYSSYIGGSKTDDGEALIISDDGFLYYVGDTWSDDFPTTETAYQKTYGGVGDSLSGGDIFAMKFDTSDWSIIYSTYIGGNADEGGRAIALDKNGNLIIGGMSQSSDYPVTDDAYQKEKNGPEYKKDPQQHADYYTVDAVLAVLNPEGSDLVYSTFYGGDYGEFIMGMYLFDGGIILQLRTYSDDLWVSENAYQKEKGNDTYNPSLDYIGTIYEDYYANRTIYNMDTYFGVFLFYDNTTLTVSNETVGINQNANIILNLTSNRGAPLANAEIKVTIGKEDYTVVTNDEGIAKVTTFSSSEYGVYSVAASFKGDEFYGGSDAEAIVNVTESSLLPTYATYLGGNGEDKAKGIFTDAEGNIYVVMETSSNDLNTTDGVFQANKSGGKDIYVAKFDANGELVFATFIGGSSTEFEKDFKVDAEGNIYITGLTASKDFPTTENALIRNLSGSQSAYLAVLSADGKKLKYSTYLGGSKVDRGWALVIDDEGHAFVQGITNSIDFPVTDNAYQKTKDGIDWNENTSSDDIDFQNSFDIFISEIDTNTGELVYSTYFGGRGADSTYGSLAVKDDIVYFAGTTTSIDFPTTPNANRTVRNVGEADSFLAAINITDNTLLYSSYIGGSKTDDGEALLISDDGFLYYVGDTWSDDFPTTPNAFQRTYGGVGDSLSGGDIFAMKFDTNDWSIVYSTYIGGSADEGGRAIALDENGNLVIGGMSQSSDYPVTDDAFQKEKNGPTYKYDPQQHADYYTVDAVLAILNPEGSDLVYSTYIGGDYGEFIMGMTLIDGGAILQFRTYSDDLWVSENAYQKEKGNDTYNPSLDYIGTIYEDYYANRTIYDMDTYFGVYLFSARPTAINNLVPEYTSVPTIQAGVENTLTLTVTNDKFANNADVIVKVICDNETIFEEEIANYTKDTYEFVFVDPTIRPIDETTVNGANNTQAVYTVIIETNGTKINTTDYSFPVLYNGYLGKDFEYLSDDEGIIRVYEITGDVVIANSDVSAYMGTGATTRNETLPAEYDGKVVDALLYVSYNWDKVAGGDFNTWNITFNNVTIAPIASYRDQGNLGKYGAYGYGLVVYNVTDLVKSGDNIVALSKIAKNSAVYPSSLLVLTDANETSNVKTVYIYENADLLANSYSKNLIAGASTFFDDIDPNAIVNATLYVFAASAQKGEGNIIFNDNISSDVWNGTSNTLDMFEWDITDIIESNNELFFDATGSTILALHQIIVVESEDHIVIDAPDVEKYYKGPERLVVYVTDNRGNVLANQSVNITINGVTYTRTTDENGTASMGLGLNSGIYEVIASAGNSSYESTVTILPTVYGDDIVKVFKNGTQYYATFLDTEGNFLANGTEVTFNINGVMYKRYINGTEGKARLNINLPQGEYVITAINPVNGEMGANNITVLPSITNNENLVKYYKNESQYYVTIIGDDGNPVGENVTVKFNINGVFYERKTNASGVARMNINLEPGNYIITAEYNGCRVSNNITVLPVLNATDLTKKYGTPDPFVATLVDGTGAPYAGQNVTFNINGVFYQRTTDDAGNAKLNINLMAGEYIITSSYNGANIANKVTVTA
ncbi:DUF3344 domain-containing protein [Methanobrevibacter millerae]|nr:DUF3344 domain-containing protein [Methanobrevibacter millerae]